ncbi:TPA: Mbeg1-like protein [Streptococcus suis]
METVKLPKELKKLGGYLFEGNEKMTLLVLPDKVESIDVNAFVNMPNLEKVYIPASVNSIGENLIFNPNTTFYVAAGSYAEKYMKERNIPYEISGDDYKHYNDGIVKSSRFSVASQTLKQSGKLALDLNYSLDTAGRTIADKEIRITLPKGAVAFEKKIKIDGKEQEAIIENDVLRIKNSADSSRIQFVVTTKANELTQLQLAAQVLYKEYGIQKSEVLGYFNEEMPFLMIKADTAISGNRVRIVGRTKPNTTVEFKLFEPIIGGTMRYVHATQNTWKEGLALAQNIISDMTGQFEAVLNLDFEKLFDVSAKQGDSFKIRAIATVEGMQVKADSEIIKVDDDTPELTRFIMRHDGRVFDLLDGELNDNVIFRPTSPFEFEVGLDNSEDISRVWVNTVRNGVKKRIQLGQKDDIFTASAYFDDSNHDFIPSGFTVEVEKTYYKDKDGDGLLNGKRMTAKDQEAEIILNKRGTSLIDSYVNHWDVSDRDLLIFAGLTYFDEGRLKQFFSGSPSNHIEPKDIAYNEKGEKSQFYDLDISKTDSELFKKWKFVKQLRNKYSEVADVADIVANAVGGGIVEGAAGIIKGGVIGGIAGGLSGAITMQNLESIVSYFIDKKEESVVISYRGTDEGILELLHDAHLLKNRNIIERTARKQLRAILSDINNNYKNIKNINIVGHSLGGYEAYQALDEILISGNERDLARLKKVINFNGPGFKSQDEENKRAQKVNQEGKTRIRFYVLDNYDFENGVATPGPYPEDLILGDNRLKLKYTNNAEAGFLSHYAHNLYTFFYYLDHGYRTSKPKFKDAENYITVPNLSYPENFILTLPETPNYVIDPSGRVLNSVTGKPVVNATAKVYYKDKDGKEVLWNAGDYSQLNPVLTTIHGEYAWDVPEGLWKVKIEKDGYEVAESDWLPVPPPQTEVNFNLQPKTYSLEFILDGGKATSILPTSYMTEVELALPSAEKEGYDFLGWFDNETRTGLPVTTTLFSTVGNKKLWAAWAKPLVKELPTVAPTAVALPTVQLTRVERPIKSVEVIYLEDANLLVGESREEIGRDGVLVVEVAEFILDGQVTETQEFEVSRTEATPRKVYRGTKVVSVPPVITTRTRQEVRVLTTEHVLELEDSDLAQGQTREEASINGQVLVEITETLTDGQVTSSSEREISRTEATPRKVYRGTKVVSVTPVITTHTRQEVRVLTTDHVLELEDSELAQGHTREEASINGQVVVEITETLTDGQVTVISERELSRTEAVPRKVYRGTKTIETPLVTQLPTVAPTAVTLPTVKLTRVERPIKSETVVYLEDPTLPVGEIRVEEGLAGLLVVDIAEYILDGQIVKVEEFILSRQEATPRKIYRGRKQERRVVTTEQTQAVHSPLGEEGTVNSQSLPNTGQTDSVYPAILGLSLFLAGTALIKSKKDEGVN